jgi:uncharacterized protein YdeI (YjbR/CyaY-like superfamily)
MSPTRPEKARGPAGDLLPGPKAYAPDRRRWRAWLEKHHASASEVWLVFYKRHTGKPSPTLEEATLEALCFGWIDGRIRRVDAERCAYRFTPRRPGSPWSELNKRRVAGLLEQGLITPAGQRAIDEAHRNGKWDASPRRDPGTSPPPALLAALRASPGARAFFAALTPGYRRAYVAWVLAAKREETRKARIARVVDRCARGIKPGIDL